MGKIKTEKNMAKRERERENVEPKILPFDRNNNICKKKSFKAE